MMRDRFPIAVLGGVLVLGGLLFALVSGAERGMFSDELSTFRGGSRGAMALPMLMRQQGVDAVQRTESFEHLDGVQTLALLGVDTPPPPPSHATRDGGVPSGRRAARRRSDPTGLGGDDEAALLSFVEGGGTVVIVSRGHDHVPLAEALDVRVVSSAADDGLRTLVPAQPHPATQGVTQLEAPVSGWLELPDDATLLLVDSVKETPAAASVRHGAGQVIFITSAALAQNAHLAAADNAAFWVNLGRALSTRGSFAFDEFHHGFVNQRSIGSFLARYGFQFAVLQLLLAAGLWSLSLRRFGRVQLSAPGARNREADLLSAISRLYREGRHHAHAGQTLKRHAVAPLLRRLGLAPTATDAELTAALERTGHGPEAAAYAAVVSQLQTVRTDDGLMRAATRLHDFSQRTARLHATGATPT